MRLYIAILLAGLLALAGVLLGLWWAPFPVALALGALNLRPRVAAPVGAALGLIAWAIPLLATHSRYGLGPTAEALAAIMGFGHSGVVPVILTLIVGTLLGLTGAWLGSAARQVVASNARVDATRNG
ncbi:MAG TPA: hypothetical protein VI172_11635 [Candidatus Dormibacteraeota bacterium]